MGNYLKFNKKENNSKRISFLFSDIIKIVFENNVFGNNNNGKVYKIENNGWSFNKKGIAKLITKVKFLLDNECILESFMEYKVNEYYGDSTKEEYIEILTWIYNCLVEALCDMILNKIKRVYAEWE